jgi:hypothetical protein
MLLVALLGIAVMTIQGSIAASTALNNITNSVKVRSVGDATAVAEAGIAEAKARLQGLPGTNAKLIGDPLATLNLLNPAPNPLWTAYLLTSNTWAFSKDPDYNVAFTNYVPTALSLTATALSSNALQTALPYWVKIRHKVEYDAELAGHTTITRHYTDGDGLTTVHSAINRGNIIYYGYLASSDTKPVQFTTAASTSASPVEIVTVFGQNGNATKAVEVEMARDVGPPLYSPMYSEGNVNFAKPGYVSGMDACGKAPNRPPVYTQDPATVSGTNSYAGSPATPQHGTLDVDRQATIDAMKGGATVVTTDQTDKAFGSASNYVTVYSDTTSPINGNGLQLKGTTGYGTLLVKGDLILANNVTWNGLIIVTGQVTLKAPEDDDTATLNIRGAILSAGIYAQKSGYDVRYNSCEIAKAMGLRPMKVIRWRTRSASGTGALAGILGGGVLGGGILGGGLP